MRQDNSMDVSTEKNKDELPYFSITNTKFVLLTLATFGLYEIWWFYLQWRQVRKITGARIKPVGRAIFSPLFCYQLFREVNVSLEEHELSVRYSAGWLTVVYIGLLVMQRLPDPYWLISMLTLLPLLAVQGDISRLHAHLQPNFDQNGRFGIGSVLLVIIGGGFWLLAMLSYVTPETKALLGSELPASYREILVDDGYLRPEEEVLFFYSGGLLSIREDGNLLTNVRVVSYESYGGETYEADARYSEIADVSVSYGESWVEDTQIVVTTVEGEDIYLVVSIEEGRDKAFFRQLMSEWRRRVPDDSVSADQPGH
ncbi:MAG: hypothetical protein ACE5G0_12465 [Rhodothermales bacterium]